MTVPPPAALRDFLAPGAIDALEDWVQAIAAVEVGEHADSIIRSPYMTPEQAARYLGAKRRRIDDLCSQGRLTRYHEGRRLLLRTDEVVALVEKQGDDDW